MTNTAARPAVGPTDEAFHASPSPYLVLDRQLRIQAVNAAYEQATLQAAEALIGSYVFDAFPDNPDAPEVHAVDNLAHSLETVLRQGRRDRMPVQRYDVPSPVDDGRFVLKVWSPTNSPLRDSNGRVTGVLHHVQDVTAAFASERTGPAVSSPDPAAAEQVLATLVHELQVNAELRDKNAHLEIALKTSRQIGMALGIVMFSHKLTAEAAFDLLREVSQRNHRKLHDVAEAVVEQGCITL